MDRPLIDLVGELSTRSEPFRVLWARHEVRSHRSAVTRLRNPLVGEITVTGDALELRGTGLTMIAYTAEPDSTAWQTSWPVGVPSAVPARAARSCAIWWTQTPRAGSTARLPSVRPAAPATGSGSCSTSTAWRINPPGFVSRSLLATTCRRPPFEAGVHQIRVQGALLPLSPRLITEATRGSHAGEDYTGRVRIAETQDLPIPDPVPPFSRHTARHRPCGDPSPPALQPRANRPNPSRGSADNGRMGPRQQLGRAPRRTCRRQAATEPSHRPRRALTRRHMIDILVADAGYPTPQPAA